MNLRRYWPKRAGMIFALSFLLVDMLIYGISWLIGSSGYVEIDLKTNLQVSSYIGRVWDVIHAPVNEIFGPLIYPYYKTDSNDFVSVLAVKIYIFLCFLQMFVVGFILGKIAEKVNARVRQNASGNSKGPGSQ